MMPFSTPQADPNKLIELRVLTIIAGEQKTSQKGKPYWRVKDSGGTEYAVFRSNIAERLDSATDPVPCAVEISVKGQYTNYAIVETDGAAQLMASAPSPVGAPQTAQNSLPTAQQGQGSPTPHFEQDRNESIRAQTTLKAAAEMYAACLGANKALKWEFEEFERIFTGTKAILDGKNELDVALDIGKKAGMVAEADPELPGPDAPADEENPDGFPF
jgi:hypothetical protein